MGSNVFRGVVQHRLDMQLDAPGLQNARMELMVEELPENAQFASDCLSTASSASTVACATAVSCAASFSTVGSVISTGS